MIRRTHEVAAVTALMVVFVSLPLQPISLSTIIVSIVANMLGSVTPDIDQPTAPFWRNLSVGGYFGRLIAKMLGGHRFLTHSLLGVLLIGFLFNALLNFLQPIMGSVNIEVVWWAYMIGVFSHLVMDSFSKEGVPWLLPIPIKFGFPPFKSWRVTTDKWVENRIIFPGFIIFNCVYIFQNYHHILELIKGISG